MVSPRSVEEQLRKLKYNRGWNRPEAEELAAILLPDEEIFECVNGWYEGGFALLCATNVRVLLVDKKPFKYLNVEDVRFDTINQIDYSHRMFNANICITAGLKNLVFKSYNQPRLRKLIGHVQHRMAEIKRIEQAEKARTQRSMKEMDQQLRSYLMSQYEQHESLRRQHESNLPLLSPTSFDDLSPDTGFNLSVSKDNKYLDDPTAVISEVSANELYEDGIKEIFGKYQSDDVAGTVNNTLNVNDLNPFPAVQTDDNLDLNPLKIAYSKLPLILSIKKRQLTAPV